MSDKPHKTNAVQMARRIRRWKKLAGIQNLAVRFASFFEKMAWNGQKMKAGNYWFEQKAGEEFACFFEEGTEREIFPACKNLPAAL